jgi:hypothetical protein
MLIQFIYFLTHLFLFTRFPNSSKTSYKMNMSKNGVRGTHAKKTNQTKQSKAKQSEAKQQHGNEKISATSTACAVLVK